MVSETEYAPNYSGVLVWQARQIKSTLISPNARRPQHGNVFRAPSARVVQIAPLDAAFQIHPGTVRPRPSRGFDRPPGGTRASSNLPGVSRVPGGRTTSTVISAFGKNVKVLPQRCKTCAHRFGRFPRNCRCASAEKQPNSTVRSKTARQTAVGRPLSAAGDIRAECDPRRSSTGRPGRYHRPVAKFCSSLHLLLQKGTEM